MHPFDPLTSRRDFLRLAGKAALGGASLPLAMNLSMMADAAAQTATDYKALVCVFLNGGNDQDNTLVPYDEASHAAYSQARGGGSADTIALARSSLTATVLAPSVPLPDVRQYALHPNMKALAALFQAGRMAVQLNVGPLLVPITRAQYNAGAPVPPKLFSHNDQQSVWQSSSPEGATVGWGGNLGDLALAGNGGNPLFTCVSVTNNAVFLSGDTVQQYQINAQGATAITALKFEQGAVIQALSTLIQQPRGNWLEEEYARITRRSIAAEALVSPAMSAVKLNTMFPATTLANQLRAVALFIGARGTLGLRRQVFFVQLYGFDTHSGQSRLHPGLVGQVSDALAAFYNATVELGVDSQVTAFTASDFGRTLNSNGDGTDHGWGCHHFVVGGAVRGRAFYGSAPPVSVGNTGAAQDQWHVGQGRLLPSTSVDQYAATLAKWFGVSPGQMPDVLPNLRNFGTSAGRPDYPVDLGFLG